MICNCIELKGEKVNIENVYAIFFVVFVADVQTLCFVNDAFGRT